MKKMRFWGWWWIIIIVLFTLGIIGYLKNKEKAWYLAFNEKDTNLIEAFIREMNMLDSMLFSDRRAFDTQLARVESAQQNIDDLGSSNPSMLTIRWFAIAIPMQYHRVIFCGQYSNEQEYSKSIKKARKCRDHFVKTYHTLQHGATPFEVGKLGDEFNKLLEEEKEDKIEQ